MPLSQRQCEYLALAWQCFESEPKIDYEKFRQVANLASAHSARELMRVTKKKLKEEYGAFNGAATTPSTPKKGGGGANGAMENGTPGSNGKGRKRKTLTHTATPGSGKKGRTQKTTPVPQSGDSDAASDDQGEVEVDEQVIGRKAKKVKVERDGAHGFEKDVQENAEGFDMFQL